MILTGLFYFGYKKTKSMLRESIEVKIIFYDKVKDEIIVDASSIE